MKKVFLIDYEMCSPRTCGRPCISKCPVELTNQRKKDHQKKDEMPVRYKKSTQKMIIISEYCIKCGICLNVCPRNAIYSIFFLDEPEEEGKTHQYPTRLEKTPMTSLKTSKAKIEENLGFRLFGLPTLTPGRVTGLCGPNGIGKSTILNILGGDLIPNFGNLSADTNKVNWNELTSHFKESDLRKHFQELHANERRVAYKKQVLRILFQDFKGKTVKQILEAQRSVDKNFFQEIMEALDIAPIKTRKLNQCSGGELQRFAIASVLVQQAEVYFFDEPCTFLDVRKRIQLADLLHQRSIGFGTNEDFPVLVVEHDLTILDFVSDVVHLFYGVPHEFGVITKVQTTKNGINSYLHGFLKTENLQFRKKAIGFKRSVTDKIWDNAQIFMEYGHVSKTYDSFRLDVEPGTIYQGEILGVVGENGCGKTTFAKILAGIIKPDPECNFEKPEVYVSYKPQYITRDHDGTVKEFIMFHAKNYDFSENMVQLLYGPLGVDKLLGDPVRSLSGGQLQRVFICTCLAKRANMYILDEPSAYLDVEERLHISSVIRTITKRTNATAICIEHDISIVDALSDRLFLFTGTPGVHGKTIGPLGKREGMNEFLKILDITFRRDEDTGRARINKKDSNIDKIQRNRNEYFYAPRN